MQVSTLVTSVGKAAGVPDDVMNQIDLDELVKSALAGEEIGAVVLVEVQ